MLLPYNIHSIYKEYCQLSSFSRLLQSKKTLCTFFAVSTLTVTSLSMCLSSLVTHSWADMHDDMQTIEKVHKIFTPLLLASGEHIVPHQTIALVNGSPITLDELLAAHGTSTFYTNTSLPPSITLLQEEYDFILQELITHALIHQDIKSRGILVTEIDLQNAERDMRANYVMQDQLEMSRRYQEHKRLYGEHAVKSEVLEKIDTFSTMLLEQGLTLEEWRIMLARQVMKDIFLEKVIEPTILLQAEEIEAAYRAHPELLNLEKRVQCQLFSANSFETAKAILLALDQKDSTALASIEGYIVEDFLFPYAVLDNTWLNVVVKAEKILPVVEEAFFDAHAEEVASIESCEKNAHYAEIIKEGDNYKVLCIQKILPSRTLALGEAYVRLERLLMSQKRAAAFADWLEKAWLGADIRIIEQLSLKNHYYFGKTSN